MKTNMGIADRTIRGIIAVGLISLYLMGLISGIVGILLILLSTVFLATSFLSVCPLYFPFGISTKSKS
jgi:hypothetical protein